MVATLKEGRTVEGFTPGKEYSYYEQYNIEKGNLSFYILDDEGNRKILTHREFAQNFWGKYNEKSRL